MQLGLGLRVFRSRHGHGEEGPETLQQLQHRSSWEEVVGTPAYIYILEGFSGLGFGWYLQVCFEKYQVISILLITAPLSTHESPSTLKRQALTQNKLTPEPFMPRPLGGSTKYNSSGYYGGVLVVGSSQGSGT